MWEFWEVPKTSVPFTPSVPNVKGISKAWQAPKAPLNALFFQSNSYIHVSPPWLAAFQPYEWLES